MIFLDLDTLAAQLRDDKLSEREKFKYAVLAVVLGIVAGPTGVLAIPNGAIGLLVHAAILTFYVFVLRACFNVNQGGDGRAFVERLVILAGPVALRVLLITNAAWFTVLFFDGSEQFFLSSWSASKQFAVSGAIQLLAYVLGFLWLRGAFEIACSGRGLPSAIEAGNRSRTTMV